MEFENNIPISDKKGYYHRKASNGCETAIHKRTGGFISHQSEYGGEGL